MNKVLLVMIAALMSTTICFGQATLVATLSHGTEVKMFYGASAFQGAHDAAQSGDVITLSGGNFSGFTMTKAITVRGTGFDANTPTYIGNTTINIPSSDTGRFSLEGIRCNYLYLDGSFSEPYFLKCKFVSVEFKSSSAIHNARFVNCKSEGLKVDGSGTVKFAHCYTRFNNSSSGSSQTEFLNCVVYGALGNFYRASFVNSILCGDNYQLRQLPAETVTMNCVALTYNTGYYYNDPYTKMGGTEVDCWTSTYPELFVSFKGTYSDTETFELTEEAKEKFLGTDGTQIGLYGGKYPYDPTPAYPRITKLNVAKQTTADDKLSVEIEVSAAE